MPEDRGTPEQSQPITLADLERLERDMKSNITDMRDDMLRKMDEYVSASVRTSEDKLRRELANQLVEKITREADMRRESMDSMHREFDSRVVRLEQLVNEIAQTVAPLKGLNETITSWHQSITDWQIGREREMGEMSKQVQDTEEDMRTLARTSGQHTITIRNLQMEQSAGTARLASLQERISADATVFRDKLNSIEEIAEKNQHFISRLDNAYNFFINTKVGNAILIALFGGTTAIPVVNIFLQLLYP